MARLKLYGMRAAYDEVMTTGIKRRHEPPRIVGDLLSAEIAEKQARSIKYQLNVAKLPLAKDLEDFVAGRIPDRWGHHDVDQRPQLSQALDGNPRKCDERPIRCRRFRHPCRQER